MSGHGAASVATIEVRGASKWYGRVAGLVRADFEVQPGITGLLGPNGAGKSTVIKLLTGQLKPSLGEVRVFGSDVRASAATRRRLGYVPDVDAFYEDMSGREFVELMARLSGLSRRSARDGAREALELTGSTEFSHRPLRTLSKGQRQRIKIAQALAHDPDLLVLDEPLAGVDPTGRREMLELFDELRERGKTLLLSSHILHEIEAVTDRIVLIAKGRVLAVGTLREIRALLREHPLRVRVAAGGPRGAEQLRELGALLVAEGLVSGWREEPPLIDEVDESLRAIVVETRDPERLFARLVDALIDLDVDLRGLRTLDESAEAVFGYLLSRQEAALSGRPA